MSGTRFTLYAVLSLVLLALALSGGACNQTGESESGGAALSSAPRTTVEEVRAWMDDGVDVAILDSRSINAWDAGHDMAEGAIRVPPHSVQDYLDDIPKGKRIVAYCT